MYLNLLSFLGCGLVILLAGKQLSCYGDLLAEKTGIGKAFIGLFLMSAVTSLPELMVGISSSALVQSADLAVGDILGSCAFNLVILSLMDLFSRSQNPLLSGVSQSHILAASLGTILLALVGLGIFLETDIVILPFIGLNSILFAVIYFVALGLIYRYQRRYPTLQANAANPDAALRIEQVIFRYVFFAIITIVAALFLPHLADAIAEQTGLGRNFVGTLFLAVSTSLPEITVSVAAVRMNSSDLAVGNILGSNIFNVFILFLDDIFYTKGHLLKDASDFNLISVFSAIIMSAIVIISITFNSQAKKKYLLNWDTLLIALVYLLSITLLYKLTSS
jgi:cation:H+ antiporter